MPTYDIDKMTSDPRWSNFDRVTQQRLLEKAMAANRAAGAGRGGIAKTPEGRIPMEIVKPFSSRMAPPAAERQTITTIQSMGPQLKALRDLMLAYGKDNYSKRGFLRRQWQSYQRQLGHTSTPDPQLNAILDATIATMGTAQAALAHSSGTRAYQFIAHTQGHIPDPAGDWEYNMDAINRLLNENGPYNSYLKSMGVPLLKETIYGPLPKSDAPPSLDDKLKEHNLPKLP